VLDLLLPVVSDTSISMEISSIAALSIGFVYVGTCHGDATSTILQALLEREESSLNDPHARFMGLGLALLFLGRQEAADATLETLKVIEHPIGRAIGVLVESTAYAGTSFSWSVDLVAVF
jgi:26S proteasome regulatory subunit N1